MTNWHNLHSIVRRAILREAFRRGVDVETFYATINNH
mgnify:FL=1